MAAHGSIPAVFLVGGDASARTCGIWISLFCGVVTREDTSPDSIEAELSLNSIFDIGILQVLWSHLDWGRWLDFGNLVGDKMHALWMIDVVGVAFVARSIVRIFSRPLPVVESLLLELLLILQTPQPGTGIHFSSFDCSHL